MTQRDDQQQNPVDERIAPRAPRGQETAVPSPTGFDGISKRRKRLIAAVLIVTLLVMCLGIFMEVNSAAQEPMAITAMQDNASEASAGSLDSESKQTESDAESKKATRKKASKKKAAAKNGDGKSSGKAGKKGAGRASTKMAAKARDAAAAKENGADAQNGQGKKNGSHGGSASGNSDATSKPNTITVTMSIDGSRAGNQDSASADARKITVEKGSSVYDVLVASGVSISGDSTYVRSIGGLAEFQCGSGSGWMYSVDGVFPNVSCGKYALKGGEAIVWAYTLNIGEDLK